MAACDQQEYPRRRSGHRRGQRAGDEVDLEWSDGGLANENLGHDCNSGRGLHSEWRKYDSCSGKAS